jgi:hypothetical protein
VARLAQSRFVSLNLDKLSRSYRDLWCQGRSVCDKLENM